MKDLTKYLRSTAIVAAAAFTLAVAGSGTVHADDMEQQAAKCRQWHHEFHKTHDAKMKALLSVSYNQLYCTSRIGVRIEQPLPTSKIR